MLRPMEIPARVTRTATFFVVHADGDASVVGHRDAVAGMSEAAFRFGTVASASLIFSTNLKNNVILKNLKIYIFDNDSDF